MNDPSAIAALTRRVERLERAGRFWRRLALACLGGLFLMAVVTGSTRSLAIQGSEEGRPKSTPVLENQVDKDVPADIKLARQRLALSREAIDIIQNAARKGANIINQRQDFYRWSYRLLGDQIYLSMDDDETRVADPEVFLAVSPARHSPERLAAFKDHLKRMEVWEAIMKPLYRDQILPPIAFIDIQAHRLEAQLWLARERMKEPPGAEDPDPREKPEPSPGAAPLNQPG